LTGDILLSEGDLPSFFPPLTAEICAHTLCPSLAPALFDEDFLCGEVIVPREDFAFFFFVFFSGSPRGTALPLLQPAFRSRRRHLDMQVRRVNLRSSGFVLW